MGQPQTVAIIGGGLAGLSCAFALRRRGIPSIVFEAAGEPGGRCSGATFLLGPEVYKNTFDLVRSLGLSGDVIEVPPVMGQLYKGVVYHHRVSSVMGLLNFRGLNLVDKAMLSRMAYLLARHGSKLDFQHPERGASLDDETVASFVKRELTQNILNYVAGPLISTMFFYSSEEASKLLYLNIAKHMQSTRLYTIRGGLNRLVEALAGVVTVETQLVRSIRHVGGAFVVDHRNFSDLVVAVPGNAVLEIQGLPDLLSEEDRLFFANCRYGRAVTVSFDLDAPVDQCYALSVPRVEKLSAATINFHDFIDPSTITATGRRVTVIGGGDSVSAQDLVDDFRRIYSRNPKQSTIREWTSAMPQFPPGRYKEVAAFLERRRPAGLFFCGDYLLGPFIEAAIATGIRAIPKAD